MPAQPVNTPLTPQECVEHVWRRVDELVDAGICEKCALKLMCFEFGLEYGRLLILYLDRSMDASPAQA